MENILTDMNELEKGMEQTRREFGHARELRSPEGHAANNVLREFLGPAEEKLKKVIQKPKSVPFSNNFFIFLVKI